MLSIFAFVLACFLRPLVLLDRLIARLLQARLTRWQRRRMWRQAQKDAQRRMAAAGLRWAFTRGFWAMTTKMHTDVAFQAPGTSAVVNAPLGTLDSALADTEAQFGDFVVTGGLPSTNGTLTLTQPSARAFVLNTYVQPLSQSLVFTASKDTYVDLDSTGAYHLTPVANGAAAPAVFANSIRLYKAVSGGAAVTSVVDLRTPPAFSGKVYDEGGAVVNAGAAKYGLINDGGVADQTGALNAAIADVPVGGTLRLPPWLVKFSTLVITKDMTIEGSGWHNVSNGAFGAVNWPTTYYSGSVLISTATAGKALDLSGAAVAVRNFMLVGPGTGTSTGITMGTSAVTAVVDVVSFNVMVANFSRGWRLEWVEECDFYGCRSRGNSTGFSLSGSTNQNVFVNAEVQNSTAKSFDLDGATGVGENVFWGGLIQNCSGTGISETGASAYCNRFVGFWIENCSAFTAYDIIGNYTVLDGFILDSTAMVANVRGTNCRIANERPAAAAGTLTVTAAAVNTIIDNSPHNGQITDNGAGTIQIGSGVVAVAAGSAGSPSVLFGAPGASQDGFFRQAAGALGMTLSGTERARLESSNTWLRLFGYRFATDTGVFMGTGAADAILRAGSTDAVRLQDSSAANIMSLVSRHLLVQGGTVPSATNTQGGTAVTSVTVSGNDTSHRVTVATGTSGVVANQQISRVTFAVAYGSEPNLSFGFKTPNATGIWWFTVLSTPGTNYDLYNGVALGASLSFGVYTHVIGN